MKKTKKNDSNSLIRAGFMILLASVIFSLANFLYQFLSAKFLGPEEYSIVASLFSIIYLISIGSTTIQNTVTKFTADFKAKKEDGKILFLFKRGFKKLFLYSLGVLVLYLILSPLIASFLKIPLISVLILSPFLILSALVPLNRGILQGAQKFKGLGINMSIEGISKVILVSIFIYAGLKANWVVLAAIMANALAFLLTFKMLKFSNMGRLKEDHFNTKGIYQFSFLVFIALFLITAIYNLDIFLVKHFFSAEQAGHYAALSLLGKVIFFGATTIGIVMFPKISGIQDDKKNSKKIFRKSLLISFFIALAILLVYFIFSGNIVSLIFGAKYMDITPLLGMFGVFMALLSLSYICVLHKLAVGKKRFIWSLLAAVILEVLFIFIFHNSLYQIIGILIILNAILLLLLIE